MLPPNRSFADEIADVLGLSADSAYRRIRGESTLSLDEVALLCNHYKINFEPFGESRAGTVYFNYQPLVNSTEDGFDIYLSNILADLKKIHSFEKRQITFAAEDIPIFHHFAFPVLTAFKIFYWRKSILNVPSLEGSKFTIDAIPPSLIETARQIYQLYSTIPSVEVWSEDTVNSTIKQIEFYWESGLFGNREDAARLCIDVENLLRKIRKEAEMSQKLDLNDKPTEENNYQLYFSDLMIGNNTILVTMDSTKASYLSYNTFNAMITRNSVFCNETEAWLKNLIRKSNLISGIGEKQRFQFFRKITDRLENLKKQMEPTTAESVAR